MNHSNKVKGISSKNEPPKQEQQKGSNKRWLKFIIFLIIVGSISLSIATLLSLKYIPQFDRKITRLDHEIDSMYTLTFKGEMIEVKNTGNMGLSEIFILGRKIYPELEKDYENLSLNEYGTLIFQNLYFWNVRDSIRIKRYVDSVITIIDKSSKLFFPKTKKLEDIYNYSLKKFNNGFALHGKRIKNKEQELNCMKVKRSRRYSLFSFLQITGVILTALGTSLEKLIRIKHGN